MKIKKDKKIISILLLLMIIFSNVSQIFAIEVGDKATITNLGDCNEEHLYYTRNGVRMIVSTKYLVYRENGKNFPAYCLNRELPGAEIGDYDITAEDLKKSANSEEIWRVLVNGFPYKTAKQMGLDNDMQAYICTKQAIYRIIDGESVNNYSAVDSEGTKMVNAIKKLVDVGKNGTQTYTDPVINAVAVNKAGVDDKNSKYVSQTFYIDSTVNVKDANIILDTNSAPQGTYIADSNNNKKTTFNKGEYFKVLIPRNNIKGNINVQATIDGYCEVYPVLYGNAKSNSVQSYALVTDPYRLASTKFKMSYTPSADLEINKISNGYSEITGKEEKSGLEGAKFEIEGEKTGYKNTVYTNKEGKIILTGLKLDTYKITELKSPDYYLIDNEYKTYEVDLISDGQKAIVNVENTPVKIDVNVDKTADKTEAQGNEIVNYTIDNIKNLSNVKLDNFTLVDELPKEVRIQKLETGTYNQDLKYACFYSTNKKTNIKLQDNLSTTQNNVIDFTEIKLDSDEYIISYALSFGTVKVGFSNTSEMKVATKVVEGLADKSKFINNVKVSGTYLEEKTEDEDDVPVEVYENILKIKKVSKEYNQYTDLPAGTAINAVFDLLDEDKKYIDTLYVNNTEELIYKYLETGKTYYLKEISVDPYYVISNELIEFKFEKNGQTIDLEIENDNVNLLVDVEKEAPTEAQRNEVISYAFNHIGNFSNVPVSNFIWGDKLPRQVRIQSLETGTWNQESTYKIQYITNKNTNWKSIGDEYNTTKNYKIDFTKVQLEEDEYVTEFRILFGEVKSGFEATITPTVKAKVNEDVQNNKIFVNDTYVTADYYETELEAKDDAHTIVYTPEQKTETKLPKTGIES